MTVIRENGEKVLLPRLGGDEFWDMIHEHYAGESQRKWKNLAILALRENAGWTLENIALVFGHHKGHICRNLEKTKTELRNRFEQAADWLEQGE